MIARDRVQHARQLLGARCEPTRFCGAASKRRCGRPVGDVDRLVGLAAELGGEPRRADPVERDGPGRQSRVADIGCRTEDRDHPEQNECGAGKPAVIHAGAHPSPVGPWHPVWGAERHAAVFRGEQSVSTRADDATGRWCPQGDSNP